jgi:hypothetical protein
MIRRLIHNFHATEKQFLTLNPLLPLIFENRTFEGDRMTLENPFDEAGFSGV